MQLDHYRPESPAVRPRPPIGRYVAAGAGLLVAATWSMAILTILVIALAIGAVAVSVLASTVKALIGSQKP